jgi:hypothetical protein
MMLARAYVQLSTCRQSGMGLGPIPATAVWKWQGRNGIRDPFVCRHVEDVIAAIDVITLRRANKPSSPAAKKEAKETPSNSPKSPERPGRKRIRR